MVDCCLALRSDRDPETFADFEVECVHSVLCEAVRSQYRLMDRASQRAPETKKTAPLSSAASILYPCRQVNMPENMHWKFSVIRWPPRRS